jgi:hypothetical protein
VLAKCANPTCSAPFRRLTEGKLFQVETQYPAPDERVPRKNRLTHHIEHFWLCSECARLVTLAFHEDRGLITVPLAERAITKRVRLVEFNRRSALPEPPDPEATEGWYQVSGTRHRP